MSNSELALWGSLLVAPADAAQPADRPAAVAEARTAQKSAPAMFAAKNHRVFQALVQAAETQALSSPPSVRQWPPAWML